MRISNENTASDFSVICHVLFKKSEQNATGPKSPDIKPTVFVEPWLDRPTDCRRHIAQAICVVAPQKENESTLERKCLGAEEKYIPIFQIIHDNFKPVLQKMFCSLRKIYIEQESFGTAYAQSLMSSDGKSQGAIMGFRKSVLDKNMDLAHWFSWKEQLNFGGEKKPTALSINTKLPHMKIQLKDKNIFAMVYFIVVHEFGHFFDSSNEVNQFDWESCLDQDDDCTSKKDSWSNISWLSNTTTYSFASFPLRESLCYYSCDKDFIKIDSADELYSNLEKTAFTTTYAATNPWDDFAEAFAFYVTDHDVGMSFDVKLPTGKIFDWGKKLFDPVFYKKLKYLDDFFNRENLKYP